MADTQAWNAMGQPVGQFGPAGFASGPGQKTEFEITPEMFEAVSSLEPLSVNVGALDRPGG